MEDLDLLKRVKKLENDVLGYKTHQPVGGSSVRVFTTMTNKEWDFEITLPESFPGSPYGSFSYYIRFRSSNQQAPFSRLRFFATVNGAPYDYTANTNAWFTSIPVIVAQDDWWAQTRQEVLDTSLVRYLLRGSGLVGQQFKIKIAVDATDVGVLTVLNIGSNF